MLMVGHYHQKCYVLCAQWTWGNMNLCDGKPEDFSVALSPGCSPTVMYKESMDVVLMCTAFDSSHCVFSHFPAFQTVLSDYSSSYCGLFLI